MNISKEFIEIEYKRLYDKLKLAEENKDYTGCLRISAKMEEIEFFIHSHLGDPDTKELRDMITERYLGAFK